MNIPCQLVLRAKHILVIQVRNAVFKNTFELPIKYKKNKKGLVLLESQTSANVFNQRPKINTFKDVDHKYRLQWHP